MVGGSGDGHLEQLVLRDTVGSGTETVPANWLFVFIGAAPHTEWLGETVLRDPRGFIMSGPDLITAGRRPPGWPLDRDPYYLETSAPECSSPATSGTSRSSGSRPPSARARWRSRSSTGTSRGPDPSG